MSMSCPLCHSKNIIEKHQARKIGGIIGASAGTIGGVASSFSGAEIGASLGFKYLPPLTTRTPAASEHY